jgi:hypothetical protein
MRFTSSRRKARLLFGQAIKIKPPKKKSLREKRHAQIDVFNFSRKIKKHWLTFIFSHPDYTVGSGISPDPAKRLAGL